jgi:hypothetical protein
MDVQRADPNLRVTVVIVVVVVLITGVVLFVNLQRWFTALAQVPTAAAQAQLLTAFAWAVGIGCVAIFWLSASLWRLGGRVRRAAQWPLSGARVIRDTPVLRGAAAVSRGRVLQGVGAALFLCAASVSVLAWRLHNGFSAGAV